MKGEINNYGINNPDGSSNEKYEIKINNDNPRFIKENSIKGQDDLFKPSEQLDTTKEVKTSSNNSKNVNQNTSQSSLSSSQTISSLSSSIGTISGVIASTVATTVMVVAVFVSALTINIYLALATMHSLVLQVQMEGAQAEDFESPIWATLTGSDGITQEQEITQDTIYLTFKDLNPQTEYVVKVRNAEKVFTEKSFFTTSEEKKMASVEANYEENTVFLNVSDVELKAGEYYTLVAKDSKGNVVYIKDLAEGEVELEFTMEEMQSLFITISVNGQIYAYNAIEIIHNEPIFDLENVVWVWSDDYKQATLVLTEVNGNRTLELTALLTENITSATCELDESVTVLAQVEYKGETFSDEKTYTIPNTLLSHDLTLHEEISATCTTEGVKAYSYCERCGKYFIDKIEINEEDLVIEALNHSLVLKPEVKPTCEEDGFIECYICERCEKLFIDVHGTSKLSIEGGTIQALNHEYSEIHEMVDATCTEDGHYAYYECSRCGKLFDEDKNEVIEEALVIPNLGHELELIIGVPATCEEDGLISYCVCERCDHIYRDSLGTEELGEEDLVLPPLGHDLVDSEEIPATCTTEGTKAYSHCERCGKYFIDDVEVLEEDLVIPILGHDYGEIHDMVDATCTENGHYAYYECVRCGKLFDRNKDEITEEDLIIPALDHEYQFKFIWEKDGSTYKANPCLVCEHDNEHIVVLTSDDLEESVFVEDLGDDNYRATCTYNGKVYEDLFVAKTTVNLSLNNGRIELYPDRYKQSSNVDSISSKTIYHISGNLNDESPLDIININESGYTATKAIFYLELDNVTMGYSGWSTSFRIQADADIDIYITVIGDLSITALNHPAIELQRKSGNPLCNIYFTSDNGEDNIHLWDDWNGDNKFGAPDGGTLTVYLNGELYNTDS